MVLLRDQLLVNIPSLRTLERIHDIEVIRQTDLTPKVVVPFQISYKLFTEIAVCAADDRVIVS